VVTGVSFLLRDVWSIDGVADITVIAFSMNTKHATAALHSRRRLLGSILLTTYFDGTSEQH
jgi:hypothetical protein